MQAAKSRHLRTCFADLKQQAVPVGFTKCSVLYHVTVVALLDVSLPEKTMLFCMLQLALMQSRTSVTSSKHRYADACGACAGLL